jgi:hypothetical protein
MPFPFEGLDEEDGLDAVERDRLHGMGAETPEERGSPVEVQVLRGRPLASLRVSLDVRSPNWMTSMSSSAVLLLRLLGSRRPRTEVVLLDLVQQGLVTDLQIVCGGLSVPSCLLEYAGNDRGFSLTLQPPHQLFEASGLHVILHLLRP